MDELTIVYYASGARDYFGNVKQDFYEIMQIGSSETINFIGIYGFGGSSRAIYGRLEKDGSLDDLSVIDDLPLGDTTSFVERITWAFSTWPSVKRGVVILGHGSGWRPEDIDKNTAVFHYKELTTTDQFPLIFSDSAEILSKAVNNQTRAVLLYDFSGKSIDAVELGLCLGKITNNLGCIIDFIGFDSCLMSTIEILTEVRSFANVIIASEQTEPASGWPHNYISSILVNSSSSLNDRLVQIPDRYADSYSSTPVVDGYTLSVIRTNAVDMFVSKWIDLTKYFEQNESSLNYLKVAFWNAYKFRCDLIDIVGLIKSLLDLGKGNKLEIICSELLDLLTNRGGNNLIQSFSVSQNLNRKAHGISIYFPTDEYSLFYSDTTFAKTTGWGELLKKIINN